MILTATKTGTKVTATITDDEGTVDSFTVNDGARFISSLDRKLAASGWQRSGFHAVDGVMVAEVARTALYTLLEKLEARG